MFTIVNNPQVLDHRRNVGEPRPEVIDHRGEPEPKRWSEKMRNEEATYKHLRQHRDALLESEIIYKKTIKGLEKEKAELLNIYEPTYNENKVLKSVLQHGPDAVKMKQLQKAKKELGEEVETLKDENKKLTEQMQDMIKKNTKARDFVLEKAWKDVLANGKNKKEKDDTKITQGPFPGKEVEIHKNMIEKESMNEDVYDLELDNVEKEIQILLNNVKRIKKQKEKLDYAILMGKGAIVRNSILENAIYEKLDEDLKAFKHNLDKAKSKHDDIKRKMEQKEKNVTSQSEEAKENGEKQVFSEEIVTKDQTKSYVTSETQTEFQAELKRAELDNLSNKFKSDKNRYIKPQVNRAVQTDFPNLEGSQTVDKETMNCLDHNQNKNMKLREAKDMPSQKISSRKVRTDYAKKLVVRRGASPNRVQSINHVPVQLNTDSSQEKETKHDKQNSPVKRTNHVPVQLKADIIQEKQIRHDKQNHPVKRTNHVLVQLKADSSQEKETKHDKQNQPIKSTNHVPVQLKADSSQEKETKHDKQNQPIKSTNHVPVQLKADSSQEKETKDDKQNAPVKRTQPVHSSYKDKFVERLPLLPKAKNSLIRTNVVDSRLQSKSVDYLNHQKDISDYENMIMVPRTNIIYLSNNRYRNKTQNNSKQSKLQSRRNLDLNMTASVSKYDAKKHKEPASLSAEARLSKSPVVEEIRSCKSESDLLDYADNEINSARSAKEFRFLGLQRNNKMHSKREIETVEIEKRNESAYDKVLANLNNQQRHSTQSVYQEFERTVKTFRERKDAVREKQMRPSRDSNLFPSLDPQAPLSFTSDSRIVSGREISQLLYQS